MKAEPTKKTMYHNDGSVWYDEWYVDGKQHRADGPAEICYNEDGSVSYESWFVDGRRHRKDLPAQIWYNDDMSVYCEEWWLDGNELTKEEIVAYKRKNLINMLLTKMEEQS